MEKYTIEDIRKAFQAGMERGAFVQAGNYFDAPLDENEYIDSLTKKELEEEIIGFTYSFLRRKLSWEEFCNATGVDYYAKMNGYEIEDNELFKLTTSQAKKYDLI